MKEQYGARESLWECPGSEDIAKLEENRNLYAYLDVAGRRDRQALETAAAAYPVLTRAKTGLSLNSRCA